MDRPLGKRWPWILALSAGALSALAGLTGIREFDQWFHMAWGRAFLRDGFAAHDFFLFPYQSLPAPPAHEWLGSTALYLSWLAGGDAGTVLLVGVLFGATLAVLVLDGLDGDAPTWTDAAIALLVAALALGAIRRRAVGRPEILAYPLLAWTLGASRRWVEGRGRAILAFPVVALLWSNVHATVLYGLGAVLLYATEAWIRARGSAPGAPERLRARTLAGVGLAGVAFAFLHPAGSPLLLGVRYALSLLGIEMGPAVGADVQRAIALAHGAILELKPPPPEMLLSGVGALLLLAAIGFPAAGRRVRWAELALAAVALLFASRAVRFVPLLAIVVSAAAARNLRAGAARIPGRWRRALWLLPPLVPAGVAASLLLEPQALSLSPAEELFPTRAADVLRAAGAHELPGLRVYNPFHFGGYLEWRLDAPVLYNDGRLLWPEGDAEIAIRPGGIHQVSQLDARWRFDALVLDALPLFDPKERLGIQALAYDPMADRRTFALVAFDDAGFLYVRRDGRLSKLLASEYRLASPARILTREQFDDPAFVDGFRAEMARAVAESPSCLYCRAGLYFAHLAAGDADAAERIFPGGEVTQSQHPLGSGALEALGEGLVNLGRDRTVAGMARVAAGDREGAERLLRIAALSAPNVKALDLLGRLRAQRGDPRQAERDFRRAFTLEPDFLDARIDLAIVLETTGRIGEARDLLREVVKASPGSPQGRQAQRRLDALDRRPDR